MKKIIKLSLVFTLVFGVFFNLKDTVDASVDTLIEIEGTIYDYTNDQLPFGGEYDASSNTLTFKFPVDIGTAQSPYMGGDGIETSGSPVNLVFEQEVNMYIGRPDVYQTSGIRMFHGGTLTLQENTQITSQGHGILLLGRDDDIEFNILGDLTINNIDATDDAAAIISYDGHELIINASDTSEINLTSSFCGISAPKQTIRKGNYSINASVGIWASDLIVEDAIINIDAQLVDPNDLRSGSGIILFSLIDQDNNPMTSLFKIKNSEINVYGSQVGLFTDWNEFDIYEGASLLVGGGQAAVFAYTDEILATATSSMELKVSTTDLINDLTILNSLEDYDFDNTKLFSLKYKDPSDTSSDNDGNNNTGDKNTGTNNTGNTDKNDPVKTNDESNIMLYSTLFVAATLLIYLNKKKTNA